MTTAVISLGEPGADCLSEQVSSSLLLGGLSEADHLQLRQGCCTMRDHLEKIYTRWDILTFCSTEFDSWLATKKQGFWLASSWRIHLARRPRLKAQSLHNISASVTLLFKIIHRLC